MLRKNWHGIMKIVEIIHKNSYGKVLYYEQDIFNLLHNDGEEFLLRAAFTGGQTSDVIPDNYYLGLDARVEPAAVDTMDDLVAEPIGNGYARQAIASSGDFAINFESNHFIATSPIVAFEATSNSWGPVRNLFLTTEIDSSGYLISTATLSSPLTLDIGDSVTMRIGMKLRECP